MSAAVPAPRAVYSPRRPFLTLRVLRGLQTLVGYGWAHVEGLEVDRISAEEQQDALQAKRWVERMTKFKRIEKEARG